MAKFCLGLAASVLALGQPLSSVLPADQITHVILAGREEARYRVRIPKGQSMDLDVIEQQGMAGIVAIYDENGTELRQADLDRRYAQARSLLIPSEAAELRVRPANHGTLQRHFELKTSPPRPMTPGDRFRLDAERLLGEGEKAHREQQSGYFQSALACYEESLKVWMKLPETSRQADVLAHIAYVENQMGDSQKALQSYQHALDLWTAAKNKAGMGSALGGMAWVAGNAGQKDKAEQWVKQALEIRRSLGDLRGEIDNLFVLENLWFVAGRNEEAVALASEALALAQKAGDRIREADADNLLGLIRFQLGNSREAEPYYNSALVIDREENDRVRIAQTLNNLGVLARAQGEDREALRYLAEALPIRKQVSPADSYANSLFNIGVVHNEIGDLRKALDEYNQALAIFRSSRNARGQGFALRELGNWYLATGDDSKAQEFFREAAAQWRSISDRRGEVLALNSLGDIAARHNDLAQAAALHAQALGIARAAGYQREEADTLGYLAGVAFRSGSAQASLEDASRELEIARNIGDKPSEAAALQNQGRAWRKLGHASQALGAFRGALSLEEQSGTRIRQAETLFELANLERDISLPEAERLILRAVELTESIGSTVEGRESHMLYAASRRRIYDLAIDIEMRQSEAGRALELSERARARGLVDILREARLDIREGAAPAVLARERELRELLNVKHDRFLVMLGAPHSAARETAARAELDGLLDEYEKVETEIRTKSPHFATLTQTTSVTVDELQLRMLDASTALIEFWLGEQRSYVWIVTRAACRGFALPPRSEIEARARSAYDALNARNQRDKESPDQRQRRLSAADATFERDASSLSRILFAPLGADLSAKTLWIASDGALDYLPLGALPEPGMKLPLIAAHEIARISSATVLAVVRDELADRAPARKTVSIFADPVFRADDERVVANRPATSTSPARDAEETDIGSLPRLVFSREEAASIAALAPPAAVHESLDFAASRIEVNKPDLANYRIVHFATHTLLNSRHPELSGIVLSTVDRRGQHQDGFLRMHDIFNLKLNADLVVLSACRTALGQEIRSEGLIGLTRGFMYAGSPQVIASLWSVDDRATAEFMTRFYEALLKRRLTVEGALRAAQLAMQKEPRWAQPYYWAAFTVQGAR
jgi:CHAT domain-containing protein